MIFETPNLSLSLKGEVIRENALLVNSYDSSWPSSLSRCISRVALMPNWVRVRL